MKKIFTKVKFFKVTIFLFSVAILSFLYLPTNFNSFQNGLLSSILGVGIAFAFTENSKKLIEYKRVKKTFGFLKLATIPYLINQSDNITKTMESFLDLCNFQKCHAFIVTIANLKDYAINFDKSWLPLIYSQDFIDSISSDDHFNNISRMIFEVILFIQNISNNSINAQSLLEGISVNFNNLPENDKIFFIEKSIDIRNQIINETNKFRMSVQGLDNEIMEFFKKCGVDYQEYER